MLHTVREPLTLPAVVVVVTKGEKVEHAIVKKAKEVVEVRSATMA